MSALAEGSMLDTPLWVVVPAAGSGRRMGGRLSKQYQLLDGTCMLQRALEGMMLVPGVQGLVVALSKNDTQWSSLGQEDNAKVYTTIGGNTRAESVLAGLERVLQMAPANTWVMVHDAARPLVATTDLQRLINAVYNSGAIGGLLATPLHDTLKKSDEYSSVIATIERRDLWQAQTPQLFRVGQLHEALLAAIRKDASAITDEASAIELAGHQPLLVEALQPNFKITRPVDWELATALLQSRRQVALHPS